MYYCVLFKLCYLCMCIVASFDPGSEFTVKSIDRLERVGGINLKDIGKRKKLFAETVGIEAAEPMRSYSPLQLFEMWIKGRAELHPTWRHLFWALREMKLDHVADQIEKFLNGIATELKPRSVVGPSQEYDKSDGTEEKRDGEL